MIKSIIFYLLSLLIPQKESMYIKEHMINTKYVPLYVYWIDESNILLSSYGYTEIYNTNTRKNSTIDTCEKCIYGYSSGIFRCEFENRDIDSRDEFSSTIYQYNTEGDLILKRDIFESVIPIVCKEDYIILSTSNPMLEQKLYVLDIKNDKFMEYLKPEKEDPFKGVEAGYITVSKSFGNEKLVILDNYYRLWIYKRK